MARPTTKPTIRAEASTTKQKPNRPAKDSGPSKRAKRPKLPVFYFVFDYILIAGKKYLSHVAVFTSSQFDFDFLILPTSQFLPTFWFFLLSIS